jgi:hypothetical protein|tara:strand:- start:6236 stop:6814 length:579 start_codon:yes stop_codon:yes gene_type:complete
MTVENAISKLRVMLGAATQEVVKVENKFAEATLVDGTEVYTEGELQAGAILFVRAGEGASEDPFAPEGKHETTDDKIITVGESGEITNIEEKGSEETVEEAEETFEEEEVVIEEKKEFDAEGMLAGIADMLLPYTDELTKIKEELSTLKERFNVVADEPASKPVRNTFSENKVIADQKLAERMDALRSIRKS